MLLAFVVVKGLIWVNRTVVPKLTPAPVAEAFIPTSDSIRLGRYLDTTTVISSVC